MIVQNAPIIELRDVHKAFGPKQVLRGVDLAVAPGQSLVIIGGSGTGKSVTIKCALGLMTPERGEIFFDGEPAKSAKAINAVRRRTGMLFQGGALFDSMTVWENVSFVLLYRDHVGRAEQVPQLDVARILQLLADLLEGFLIAGEVHDLAGEPGPVREADRGQVEIHEARAARHVVAREFGAVLRFFRALAVNFIFREFR